MAPLDSGPPSGNSSRTARIRRPAVEEGVPPSPAADLEGQSLPGVPAILGAAPTLGTLLAALRRRWLLALTVALLGGALTAAILGYFIPGVYVAEVRLLLRRPPDYMPGSHEGTFDDYIRSQVLLLRSGRVL